MDLGLKGKVAAVLGASQGIGRGCAEALAEEGVKLAICARSAEALSEAREALSRRAEVLAETCDVTDGESMNRFLAAARARFGRVDILVNNCGGPKPGGFDAELPEADWAEAFERCLMQVVRWTYAVSAEMSQRGWGRIVHIVSTSVRQPIDNLILSNSLRPGVLGFTKTAARALAPKGVLVNSVLPGSVMTERALDQAREQQRSKGIAIEDFLKKKASDVPLGRLGAAREIGDVVAFLCSERASYVTGAAVIVDGGLVRGLP